MVEDKSFNTFLRENPLSSILDEDELEEMTVIKVAKKGYHCEIDSRIVPSG